MQKFSFDDRENSYRYNPFCFVNTKKDVEELASGILDTVDHLVVCADFYHAYNKRSAAINMSNKTKSTVETEKIGF